jgi:cobalt-precorrin-5B (C1)-methyltransferase
MQLFPELPEIAFVELSVFTGDALKTCVAMGVRSVVFVGMIGKMIKTAQGHMQTHVAGNQVDFAFLARVCQEAGAPEALVEAVAGANTGRHFLELCLDAGFLAPLQRIAELALEACLDFVRKQGGGLEMETILIDFDGNVLGRARGVIAPPEAEAPRGAAVPLLQRLADDPAHAYDDDEPLEETT